MQEPICIQDFAQYTEENLPKYASAYFNSGADDEFSVNENYQAFRRLRIRPSVLKGISNVDTSTTVLDVPIPFPVCIAPTAFHKMAHPDGEIATVKAAASCGIGMTLSMGGTTRIGDLTSAADGNFLMLQLQFFKDKDITLSLVNRAEKEGIKALILTVDCPVPGNRRNQTTDAFTMKFSSVLDNILLNEFVPAFAEKDKESKTGTSFHSIFDSCSTWEDVEWLRSKTKLPIVLKGILTGEDAAEAVRHGVNGIIVSNHGGRQLDGVPATIEALPEVVKAVDGKCEVFVDGGIRSGTDVLKALALGARAVFIGRPIIWGLAYKGEEGVKKVLNIIKDELRRAMFLSGCDSVKNIKRSLVVHENYYSRLLSDFNPTY